MEILSEKELAARVDYRSPLHPKPEERESLWRIPFEYGGLAKGTLISVALAKTIAAELREAIAEAEKRDLRRAFDDERRHNEDLRSQLGKAREETFSVQQERNVLTHQLRELRKKHRRPKAKSRP